MNLYSIFTRKKTMQKTFSVKIKWRFPMYFTLRKISFYRFYGALMVQVLFCSMPWILNAQTDLTFKKTLVSDKEMRPLSIEAVSTGGFIVGGLEKGANDVEWSGFMLKLTEQGETEWKRAVTSDSSGGFQQVIPTKDGGFVGVNNYLTQRDANGNFTANALTWCKTNASGAVQWAKTINEGTKIQGIPAIDLEIADDGSIFTVGAFGWGANSRTVINKISAQGNQIYNPSNFYIDSDYDVSDMIIAPNKELVVVGSTNTKARNDFYIGAVVHVSEATGALIPKPAKIYLGNGVDINFKKVFSTSDGGLLVVGVALPDKHLLVKLDRSGNVEWSKIYALNLVDYTPKEVIKTKDNSLILMGYSKNKTVLFKLDLSGNILWSRTTNAQILSIGLLAESSKGNILAVGSGYSFQNPGKTDFYLTLFDKNGFANNCTLADANILVEKGGVTAQNINSDFFTYFKSSFRDNLIESNVKTLQTNLLCKCLTVGYLDTAFCGGNSIKVVNKTYDNDAKDTFLLSNGFGCDSILFLKVTKSLPAFRTIDTTICKGDTYKFGSRQLMESGTYPLNLKTKTGCDSIVTLNLIVRDTATQFIDLKICDGDTYSFFSKNLTQSGVYTGKAKLPSGCDSTVVLTLTVSPKPVQQENKEQILTIIAGDTLQLSPCVKGRKFDWSPQNNISCTTCDTPSVFPTENVLIKAKIVLETGCLGECAYQITVNPKIINPKPFDVPNAFSPNGDKNNDVFQVVCSKIKIVSLDIYNRWGNLVHRQLGENAAWDGTSKGQAMGSDVFIYVLRYINLESQKEEVTYGDINLIR
jgi:gliding motility-associated-like protein